jgi:hypothetical protein
MMLKAKRRERENLYPFPPLSEEDLLEGVDGYFKDGTSLKWFIFFLAPNP